MHQGVAGATGGLVSSFVTCPLDVAKTRLQFQGTSGRLYTGPFRTCRNGAAADGRCTWPC